VSFLLPSFFFPSCRILCGIFLLSLRAVFFHWFFADPCAKRFCSLTPVSVETFRLVSFVSSYQNGASVPPLVDCWWLHYVEKLKRSFFPPPLTLSFWLLRVGVWVVSLNCVFLTYIPCQVSGGFFSLFFFLWPGNWVPQSFTRTFFPLPPSPFFFFLDTTVGPFGCPASPLDEEWWHAGGFFACFWIVFLLLPPTPQHIHFDKKPQLFGCRWIPF